jgi:hypothetical protein
MPHSDKRDCARDGEVMSLEDHVRVAGWGKRLPVIRGAAKCEAAGRWDCVPRVVDGGVTKTAEERENNRASALAAYRKAHRESEE